MTLLTIPIDDLLASHPRAVAEARGEELNRYAEAVAWHEEEVSAPIPEDSAQEDVALREGLEDFAAGRFHPFDPEAALQKHGLP